MNKYIKLFCVFLMLGGAVYAFTHRETGWGVFLILSSLAPLFLFFKNEFLLMAFFRFRKNDIDGVTKWLGYIKNPKSQLIKSQQAYYYFLNGLLSTKSGVHQSEQYMRKALELGLSFKQDQAMAKLNLAIAAGVKGRKREAEMLLANVKKLDKAGLLDDQVKMVKEQLKRTNVGRNFHNPQLRRRGKFF